MNNLRMEYNGSVYGFSRDGSGIGYWYCVSGRVPGIFGGSSNLLVPRIMSSELAKEAVNQGLACAEELAKFEKKKEKPKRRVSVSAGKKNVSAIKGGFNPFARKALLKLSEEDQEVASEVPALKKLGRYEDEETTSFFSEVFAPEDEETDEDDVEIEKVIFDEVEAEEIREE